MRLTYAFLLLIVSFSLGGMTSCSLSRLKSEGQASPSPGTQHDAEQTSKPAAEPTRSANWNEADTESAPANNQVADQLHTPEKGNPERQAIMDGLRAAFDDRRSGYYQPHRGSIVFVVNKLKVHNGWAWTYADPHSSDSNDSFGETNGFLLQQSGDQWKVMKLPAMVNDPDDPENLDYPTRKDVERIRKMYPSVPADIFQK